MASIEFKHIPSGLWIKLLFYVYKLKNYFRPAVRVFRLNPRMSWAEIEFAVKALEIPINRYGPEVICGIGVGGTIFGAILAGNLNDLPFFSIDRIVSYKSNKRIVELVDFFNDDSKVKYLKDKRVLTVSGPLPHNKI